MTSGPTCIHRKERPVVLSGTSSITSDDVSGAYRRRKYSPKPTCIQEGRQAPVSQATSLHRVSAHLGLRTITGVYRRREGWTQSTSKQCCHRIDTHSLNTPALQQHQRITLRIVLVAYEYFGKEKPSGVATQ